MKSYLEIKSALVLSVALVLCSGIQVAAQKSSSDEEQIQQLLADYAKSVDTLDLDLAERIWSHAPETSFIHPRGTELGFTQVRNNFYKLTMATFSQRELLLENPAVHVSGDSAWSQMTWTFHATVKGSGQKITTTGRETQIYHKEHGTWRIVHVHYSGPPITGALRQSIGRLELNGVLCAH